MDHPFHEELPVPAQTGDLEVLDPGLDLMGAASRPVRDEVVARGFGGRRRPASRVGRLSRPMGEKTRKWPVTVSCRIRISRFSTAWATAAPRALATSACSGTSGSHNDVTPTPVSLMGAVRDVVARGFGGRRRRSRVGG
jgi:hypothetical protein